jgi:hypothetical protein
MDRVMEICGRFLVNEEKGNVYISFSPVSATLAISEFLILLSSPFSFSS